MTHPAPETYSDLGTPELHKRLPVTQVHLDSERIDVAKVVEECLIDRLWLAGRFRSSGDTDHTVAERRKLAAEWLRELFEDAGLRGRCTMAYSIFGQAGSPPEMTDSESWNFGCWKDTLADLGEKRAFLLVQVCAFDAWPGVRQYSYREFRSALDRLAEIRGL